MNETNTCPEVRVGDHVVPLRMEPEHLQAFYAGRVGLVRTAPRWTSDQCQVQWPTHEAHGQDIWWVAEWAYAEPRVGDGVRVVECLAGASERFKQVITGQSGTVIEIGEDGVRLKYDRPHDVDGEVWDQSLVKTVAVTARGTRHTAPEPRQVEVGEHVRIVAALPAATPYYREQVTGRTGVVEEVTAGDTAGVPWFRVRLDEPVKTDRLEVVVAHALDVIPYGPGSLRVKVDAAPLTAEELLTQIRDLNRRYEAVQDALGEEADDRDWCSEFEDFCNEAGIEARRSSEPEREYRFNITLSYSVRSDLIVDAIESMSSDVTDDYVDFQFPVSVTITTSDPDNVDVGDYLRDAGYSEYSDYTVDDYEAV